MKTWHNITRAMQQTCYMQDAYGAIAYIRHEYEDNLITSQMVASKSKVAPLTPVAVPRLELLAAILRLRLTQSMTRSLEIQMPDVSFYSDSNNILWWIRDRQRGRKDFRTFVANRVGEIQSFRKPSHWEHVPTDQNPADLCTTGLSAHQSLGRVSDVVEWT